MCTVLLPPSVKPIAVNKYQYQLLILIVILIILIVRRYTVSMKILKIIKVDLHSCKCYTVYLRHCHDPAAEDKLCFL